MSDLVFVDTNVLIYAVDEANPRKHATARTWRDELWKSHRGRLSFQVLHEFYVNVTQKYPGSRQAAQSEVRDLLAWHPVVLDETVLERGWKIQERYRLSFWDSLIVSAAKAALCRYLLTEDLQADQELDGMVVVDPFTHDPSFIGF